MILAIFCGVIKTKAGYIRFSNDNQDEAGGKKEKGGRHIAGRNHIFHT